MPLPHAQQVDAVEGRRSYFCLSAFVDPNPFPLTGFFLSLLFAFVRDDVMPPLPWLSTARLALAICLLFSAVFASITGTEPPREMRDTATFTVDGAKLCARSTEANSSQAEKRPR